MNDQDPKKVATPQPSATTTTPPPTAPSAVPQGTPNPGGFNRSKVNTQLTTIRQLLDKSKGQIKMALPKHMDVDRLVRIAMTSVQRTPKLLECDPITLLGAVVQSAQLGLEPDGVTGQAYLIPFMNRKKNRMEVQFIPGYRGLVSLARRSGKVTKIEAHVVHEHDEFRFQYGVHETLDHLPTRADEPGPVIYAYAIASYTDGTKQFDVMTVRELEAIRSRSKSPNDGPWVTDTEEMYKKTTVRRISKMLDLSPEFARAVALEDKLERGEAQELSIEVDPTEVGSANESVDTKTGEITETTKEGEVKVDELFRK